MTHTVELRKPTTEENNRRWDEESERYTGEQFDRGERIIMVDGKRWGRTIVTHHGCHGTRHTFRQDHGDVIVDDPTARYPHEFTVRSEKRRRWLNERDNWQPTDQKVLAMAQELVATGKLRDPEIVKREAEEHLARYRQAAAAEERERIESFRAKAMEALQINDPTSAIIDRVVAAMEWARDQ